MTEQTNPNPYQVAPQDRSTPVKFEHALPHVRAKVRGGDVHIQTRYEYDTRYTSGVTLEGREGVEELRDYLNAWLEADSEEPVDESSDNEFANKQTSSALLFHSVEGETVTLYYQPANSSHSVQHVTGRVEDAPLSTWTEIVVDEGDEPVTYRVYGSGVKGRSREDVVKQTASGSERHVGTFVAFEREE